MTDNSGVLAPSLFQRIGKQSEADRIEIAGGQAPAFVNLLGQPDQCAVAPGKHRGGNGHGPERVAHKVPQQLSLLDKSGVPRSNSGLPCLTGVGEDALISNRISGKGSGKAAETAARRVAWVLVGAAA